MEPLRLAIADDHDVLITGLRSVFSDSRYGIEVVATASNGRELLDRLGQVPVDVILLDLNMPGGHGMDYLPLIREAHTDVKVVIFTMYDQPKFIKEAFRQGAEGYILKSTSLADLVDGVRRVKEGHVYLSNGLSVFPGGNGKHDNAFEDGFLMRHSLTRRELEVLELIVRAKSNKEIADQLFISDQTVSVHRKNLMRKLKVSSTAALVRFFVDQDMFSK